MGKSEAEAGFAVCFSNPVPSGDVEDRGCGIDHAPLT